MNIEQLLSQDDARFVLAQVRAEEVEGLQQTYNPAGRGDMLTVEVVLECNCLVLW